MNKTFPIYSVEKVFNPYSQKKHCSSELLFEEVSLEYPCRLALMIIDPAGFTMHENLVFKPGEVNVSINLFIKTHVKALSKTGGKIEISQSTKRKGLIKHAYFMMCDALKIKPSLYMAVEDNAIPTHCGFGTSSVIIASVCAAINEMYGNPISASDLIKYVAANHGEEVEGNDNLLKTVPCIGGSASSGLVEAGIIIVAGQATVITQIKHDADIIIGIPSRFKERTLEELMSLEEKSAKNFAKVGKKYSKSMAYEFLHKIIPDLYNGDISSLAQACYEYHFNMGIIKNYSLVYPEILAISYKLRELFENKHCQMLSTSSIGPAFFVMTDNPQDKATCLKKMRELDMTTIETSICNRTYQITKK